MRREDKQKVRRRCVRAKSSAVTGRVCYNFTLIGFFKRIFEKNALPGGESRRTHAAKDERCFLAALFLILAASFSYGETITIDEVVRQYSQVTELQRPQTETAFRYKMINAAGTIEDVLDWDTFDERTDTAGHYYQVVTAPKTTAAGARLPDICIL